MTLTASLRGLHWPPWATRRRRVIAAALALALALVIAAIAALLRSGGEGGTEARPEAAPGTKPATNRPRDSAPVTAVQPDPSRSAAASPVVDIFASRTWQPPPPPPQAAAETAPPPPPPQAPPLPFRLVGRFVEPGQATVFLLAEAESVHAVSVGDSIGDTYRIEKLEGGKLVFRYRPMNVRQTLAVGDAS